MKPQERTRAILNSSLKTKHKLLLIAIADRLSSDAGTCWPGNQLLADACTMSVRRMQDNKRALVASGVLQRTITGKRATYSIRWDVLSIGRNVHGGRNVLPTMDETSTLTMDETSNRSDHGSDQEATTRQPAPNGTSPAIADGHCAARPEAAEPDAAFGLLPKQQSQGETIPRSNDDDQKEDPADVERKAHPAGGAGDAPRDVAGREGSRDEPEGTPSGGPAGSGSLDLDDGEGDQRGPDRTKDARAANSIDVVAIWEKVNAYSPTPLRLTKPRRQQIKAREKEGGPGSVETVARWVYTSAHRSAVYLRNNGYDSPKTWLRPGNFIDYLEKAESGNGSQNGNHGHNGYILPPAKALDHAIRHVARNGTHFDRWHEDERTHAALRKAASSIGGRVAVGELDEWKRRRVEQGFEEAYVAAWGGA